MANCAAIVSDRLAVAVCCGVAESCTLTEMLVVPAVVGVPLKTPPELSESPPGNVGADQTSVPVPPVAARVCE